MSNYIRTNLRATRVVIVDGQDSYSVGLSDTVERLLKAVVKPSEALELSEFSVPPRSAKQHA